MMRGSVAVRRRYRRVELVAGDWERTDVAVPTTFIGRWRGLRAVRSGTILLPGSSVHTLGMASPLRVVAIDASGVVVSNRVVERGRICTVPRAAWMLELPVSDEGPPLGNPVEVVASSG